MDAYVLGGGGQLGASEVGMLRALIERGIAPDLVVGTSVGAINGAAIASDPSPAMVQRLQDTWSDIERSDVFAGSLLNRLATLARTGTHLHGNDALRATLTEALPIALIEDLPVRFQCVAASIERAAEHWFIDGPVVDAVLASAAVPGILPPVEVRGEHYIDGGIVNSIPVDRAVQLGADRIFVMHVGRLDRPLEPPRWPWEVALVAFEIARRHRFARDMSAVPDAVEVHLLPAGEGAAPRWNSREALRYRDVSGIGRRIDGAYRASADYLGTVRL
jgi:NTE family protein